MIGLNDSQEFKKIRGLMDEAGITDTTKRENYLLRLLVEERADHKRTKYEVNCRTKIGSMNTEKVRDMTM